MKIKHIFDSNYKTISNKFNGSQAYNPIWLIPCAKGWGIVWIFYTIITNGLFNTNYNSNKELLPCYSLILDIINIVCYSFACLWEARGLHK